MVFVVGNARRFETIQQEFSERFLHVIHTLKDSDIDRQLELDSRLINALENFRDTPFLFLMVRDLPDEPLFAQLDQFIQFFFKGIYEQVCKLAFLSSLRCPTIQFLLHRLQLSSRRI